MAFIVIRSCLYLFYLFKASIIQYNYSWHCPLPKFRNFTREVINYNLKSPVFVWFKLNIRKIFLMFALDGTNIRFLLFSVFLRFCTGRVRWIASASRNSSRPRIRLFLLATSSKWWCCLLESALQVNALTCEAASTTIHYGMNSLESSRPVQAAQEWLRLTLGRVRLWSFPYQTISH